MTDIAVGTLGAATAPTVASTSAAALQSLDQDAFLDLLVAQMKNQNPLSPSDSNEFLGQAAQFASVEQLTKVAQGQAELRSMQMIGIATSMVGQQVTAVSELTGEQIAGEVTSVRFGAEPILIVDGAEIPLSAVRSLTENHPGESQL